MKRGAFALALWLVLLAVSGAQAGPATQLTDDPAIDWDPSWSPDGTEIAFGSDRSGDEIWSVNVQTLTLRRVGVGSSPAWSPDGSKIAVEGMWILNSDGSGSPQPLSGGDQPAWSPDGGRIAFSDGDAICTVNVDGTGFTQVTFDDPGMYWYDSHPAWSPDGTEIAFVSDRGGDYAVWTIHPDGTNLRFIHDCPGDWAAEPAWSPDGQWISFQYLGDVYAVDRDGANLRQITLGGGGDGVWSPDGQWVAFTSGRSGNPEIWITADAAELPSGPTITYPVDGSAIAETVPTFTWDALPSADHLCLCLEEAGHSTPVVWQKGDIPGDAVSVAYDADGGARDPELNPGSLYRLHLIAWFLDEGVSVPRWSFGEGIIEFWVAPKPAAVPIQGTMLIGNMDSWNASFISGDSGNIYPAPANATGGSNLSLDETKIVYNNLDDGLHVCNADGSDDTALGIWGCKPHWSPDGARIAFSAPTEDDPTPEGCYGAGEVFVINGDGSELTRVTNDLGPDRIGGWSPDGQYLTWVSVNETQVWVGKCDGTDAQAITGPGFPLSNGDMPSWSPDGSRILVQWRDEPSEGEYLTHLSTIAPDGSDPCLLVEWAMPEEASDPAWNYTWWLDPNFPECSPDGSQIAFCSARHVLPELGGMPDMEVYVIGSDGSDRVRITYDFERQEEVSWAGPNTNAGGPVSVTVGNVTLTYEEVVAEGSTSIVVTDELPAPEPEGLTFVEGFGYHIATSATISGTVTVEMDYSDTAYPPVLGERLSLLVWDGAEWVDITVSPVDTANYIIRGEFTPGAERDWYVALALDRPSVPDVKVMFQACTEGRPAGPGTYVADADLSNPVRLLPLTRGTARLPECICGCGELAPVWSPDGTRVVMGRTDSGTLEMLDLTALIQSPGQVPYTLTDELEQPIYGQMPGWSPSGDQIVYASLVDPMAYPVLSDSIRAVNPDGTGMHSLYTFPEPTTDNIRWTAWSPDAARIVFEKAAWIHYEAHLWVLEDLDDPGGVTLRQLTTNDSYTEDTPHWSPDGTHIVFTRSPRDSGWWEDDGSEIWVKNVGTGVETRITDEPGIAKLATGWCPYDGHIYYIAHPVGDPQAPESVHRMLPDGTGIETVASDISPLVKTLERWSWAPTGVWIDGLNALPGEAVTAKMGIADAESLAGVQASVHYTGLCNTLAMYSVEQADAILDWTMPAPVIGPNAASFLAFAPDPENQNISGPGHLFDLNVVNHPDAQPADIQLLTFDDLLLSDEWGEPIERVSFDGGVRTVPFAYIEVSDITGPVCADSEDPVPFTVTVTALDWDGWSMPDCDVAIELGVLDWGPWRYLAEAITPTSAPLTDGVWSGEVTITEPKSSMQIVAHWEDLGGTSNAVQAIGKGDPSGDSRISIFDVVKIANMAIERGTWEPWQWWAADLNGDDEVNVFDVVICANEAMAAMETMGVGRAGSAVAPAEHVAVSTDVEWTGTQAILSVHLSDCAGLAGIQVELGYDAKKLAYAGVAAGELLTGARSWAVMGNDLGGTVKAITYTPSAEVLLGGDGTILTFTFNRTGKGKAKVRLTSVELADVEGSEIPCQMSAGKGGGKGKSK